jgi:paraquat-inducible protein B
MSGQGKVNPGLIGGFVLGALLLGLAAVFYLSGGGFGSHSDKFILYFEGDVKGLQVGSPVNFRGVRVGQVESMSIAYESQSQEFRIPVIISIDSRKVGSDDKEALKALDLQTLIEQGLRARLNLQSLVTGKLEIDLDLEPGTEVRLVGRGDAYPEIPTVQSNMEKLANAFEELPVKRIIRRVTEILDSIDQIVSDREIPKTVDRFILVTKRLEAVSLQIEQETPKMLASSQSTLAETRQLIGELTQAAQETRQLIARTEGQLDSAFSSWDATMTSGESAFEEFKQVANSADQVVSQDSPLVSEMSAALRELAAAARSIRVMSDYLERHPEALLRGKQ